MADPLHLLADLAIPTVLLAFGISLSSRAADHDQADRVDLTVIEVFKIHLMPPLAFVYAHWVLGPAPEETLLVTVLAALPAAQNTNTYAAVYRRNESLVRDATLTSTLVSVPAVAGIVALLS